MNYSPLLDALVTVGELVVLALLVVNYVFDAAMWRRSAEMFRRGGMWGGA
jgi:uncharacterized membrane protein